jgi:Fur family ferric uptake transcriptional regulator
VAALLGSGGHVTADDLAAEVQLSHPETALSTVYRTMEVLERAGLVEHLHTGTGPAVWHLTGHDHQHLVCQVCGAVVEVGDAEMAGLVSHVEEQFGFVLDTRHFALVGRCASCASVPAREHRPSR